MVCRWIIYHLECSLIYKGCIPSLDSWGCPCSKHILMKPSQVYQNTFSFKKNTKFFCKWKAKLYDQSDIDRICNYDAFRAQRLRLNFVQLKWSEFPFHIWIKWLPEFHIWKWNFVHPDVSVYSNDVKERAIWTFALYRITDIKRFNGMFPGLMRCSLLDGYTLICTLALQSLIVLFLRHVCKNLKVRQCTPNVTLKMRMTSCFVKLKPGRHLAWI